MGYISTLNIHCPGTTQSLNSRKQERERERSFEYKSNTVGHGTPATRKSCGSFSIFIIFCTLVTRVHSTPLYQRAYYTLDHHQPSTCQLLLLLVALFTIILDIITRRNVSQTSAHAKKREKEKKGVGR